MDFLQLIFGLLIVFLLVYGVVKPLESIYKKLQSIDQKIEKLETKTKKHDE